MQVRFLDLTAPHPYDKNSLKTRPMGGTESTVVRIANALDELGHETRIDQKNEAWGDVTVVLRDPANLAHVSGPCVLWMHDLMSADFVSPKHQTLLDDKNPLVVAVSHFHQRNLKEFFQAKIAFIYNPVDPICKPLEKDPNKIVFLSSPHKGLDTSLEVFAEMLKLNPDYRLYVLNPGYYDGPTINTGKVKTIGPVKHDTAMKHLGQASLLLHANKVFPETMGIVYAEAAACGTKTLTYDIGAASEIVGNNGWCASIDRTAAEMADRGHTMQTELLEVHPNTQYALEAVVHEWEKRLLALI